MAETLVSDPSLVGVTSPTIGPDGALLVASSTSGDVQQVDAASGAVEPLFNTGGAPSSLAFDGDGTLIVCDAAHATVFEYGKDQQLRDLVKDYEDGVQKAVKKYEDEVGGLVASREKDILTV